MTETEIKYLDYLYQHKAAVKQSYVLLVSNNIIKSNNKLDDQIKAHDKSKFDDEEFYPYAERFYGKSNNVFEFKNAKKRHMSLNPHHWQYWVKNGQPTDIPTNYIIEMICDLLSFSIVKNDLNEIQKYYESEKSNMKLTDNTQKKLEKILTKIKNIPNQPVK